MRAPDIQKDDNGEEVVITLIYPEDITTKVDVRDTKQVRLKEGVPMVWQSTAVAHVDASEFVGHGLNALESMSNAKLKAQGYIQQLVSLAQQGLLKTVVKTSDVPVRTAVNDDDIDTSPKGESDE